jgi:hypothetical protein
MVEIINLRIPLLTTIGISSTQVALAIDNFISENARNQPHHFYYRYMETTAMNFIE